MTSPILDFIAREHPAFVHVPLGLVVTLPLAMLGSFRAKDSRRWVRTSFFMAVVALLGSFVALGSGLMWGRQINLIPTGALFPTVTSETQVLQRMMQLHELAAISGVVVGSVCVWLIWRVWHPLDAANEDTAIHFRHQMGRRLWERGVGAPALVMSLLWLGCWGFCGKLGGIMVFGNEETNKAAAEADALRKNNVEADLPIRALDYASLEPAQEAPFLSKAHGGHWGRVWVTASFGVDKYKAGAPLPAGAYLVMSTVLDAKGKPGFEPGPLLMRETLADGRTGFAYYWGRVPEGNRAETGGDDMPYWRSGDPKTAPKLASCAGCHPGTGPAKAAP
ncbi:MAG TPA: hypothetical protein VJ623_01475 [Holophagaceae bacterium]|nr:hypothetical protein [Holophagaceae bacterium]